MTKKPQLRTGNGAVIYSRVSDQSQVDKGHSIKEQGPILRELAQEKGYITQSVFADAGKSGTSTVGRQGLMEALHYAKENKNVSAFIVLDTSRLARQESDYFAIRAFLRQNGIKLISKNQPGIDDSHEGALVDGIMAAVNAFQSRMTGRKVSEIMHRLGQQGKPTGEAPLGYKNENIGTKEKPHKIIEIDQEKAPFVLQAFQMYSTGDYSVAKLTEIMNEKGLRSIRGNEIHRSNMTHLLKNPYYTGKVRYKNGIYTGQHKGLISDELFQKCQEILAEHNQYATRKRNPENDKKFFLRAFLKCGICKHKVTGSHVKKKDKDYYYCSIKKNEKGHHSNKGQTTEMQEVETQVFNFFSLFNISPEVTREILERAKEILNETHSSVDREHSRLIKKNTGLEKQRQTLEIKLLEGVMTDETYTRQHQRIENEIASNKLRAKEIDSQRKGNTKLFESLTRLASNLSEAYLRADSRVKKMYLNIFWQNFEMKNKRIYKAIPSKAVTALMNDRLITLKADTPEEKVLISSIWYPR